MHYVTIITSYVTIIKTQGSLYLWDMPVELTCHSNAKHGYNLHSGVKFRPMLNDLTLWCGHNKAYQCGTALNIWNVSFWWGLRPAHDSTEMQRIITPCGLICSGNCLQSGSWKSVIFPLSNLRDYWVINAQILLEICGLSKRSWELSPVMSSNVSAHHRYCPEFGLSVFPSMAPQSRLILSLIKNLMVFSLARAAVMVSETITII